MEGFQVAASPRSGAGRRLTLPRALALLAGLLLAGSAPAAAPAAWTLNPSTVAGILSQARAERQRLNVRKPAKRDRERMARLAIDYAGQAAIAEALGVELPGDPPGKVFPQLFFDVAWRLGKRAREGDVRAMESLELLHRKGWVAAQDMALACSQAAAAARRGSAIGLFAAARCQAQDSPARARDLLSQAAAAGHPAAQEVLGRQCLEATDSDPVCARRWIGQAARAGRVSAMSLMGWLLAAGRGGPRDLVAARDMYTAAAAADDMAAQNNLGELWELGQGGRQDVFQAIEWYQRAAESGFAPAQFNLGRMLLGVQGIPPDRDRARPWLEKASAQGVAEAGELLRGMDAESKDGKGR